MTLQSRQIAAVGTRLGRDLTVLGVVDAGAPDPVYMIWHRRRWCPMACKAYRKPRKARHDADVLRRLKHPNIVRGLGLHQRRYLLMDFLDGPTVRHLLRDHARRLTPGNALRIAIYVGAALIHMHACGFLHLDVKPGNIAIVRGRPVLFDVGTVRRMGSRRPDAIIGTDAYMSPEQCQRDHLTPASDVFALGATLYEMLTGCEPFARRRRRAFPQTVLPPVPLREHLSQAPAKLESLLLRCLARDPRQRPPLPELLPALHGLIRGGPRLLPEGLAGH